jgi:hypothetical protein
LWRNKPKPAESDQAQGWTGPHSGYRCDKCAGEVRHEGQDWKLDGGFLDVPRFKDHQWYRFAYGCDCEIGQFRARTIRLIPIQRVPGSPQGLTRLELSLLWSALANTGTGQPLTLTQAAGLISPQIESRDRIIRACQESERSERMQEAF